MLVGRFALDEYNDPTDQLTVAITNAIIPTNSNFILGESNSTNCAVREGNINIARMVGLPEAAYSKKDENNMSPWPLSSLC